MSKLELLSPAKINLYLNVSEEKTDAGFHVLKSVFHMLDFGDIITIEPAEELSCECIPALSIPQEANLAYKAAQLMGTTYGIEPNVKITIIKRIPDQAGLAGGSSNAATVILGLARMWGLSEDPKELSKVAVQLGADVANFLYGVPTLMGNVGDELIERFEPLKAPVVIAKPAGGVSTKEAYALFDKRPDIAMPIDLLLIGMREGDAELVASHVSNNLELAAIELVPEISRLQAIINAQAGSNIARVTGSGSCVFSLFDTQAEADAAQKILQEKGFWAQSTTLSAQGIRFLTA